MNNKKIKTMKSKSIIGAALVAIFTLGTTTSCEDMFDIESSRVVYEKNHNLNSTADSAYTTLGVLKCMQQIADRYIILGEVRGDMVDINEYTKTSLRNLAEFNFEDDNEYLNVRDYYAVINNCNYALAKMDTTLAHNNERVMIDEYAALLGIRAWTYLQLAINYGKVPYYTNPITTVADSERDYPMLDVKGLAAELIPQLIPYIDYDLPVFVQDVKLNKQIFPVLQLVIGDLYLWSGDYANAVDIYKDYLTTNSDYNYMYGEGANVEVFRGLMGFNHSSLQASIGSIQLSMPIAYNWYSYLSTGVGYENLSYIPMLSSSAEGTVSEVASLFISTDNTHDLNPSAYYTEICSNQVYCNPVTATGSNTTVDRKAYTINTTNGDQRRKYYTMERQSTGEGVTSSFQYYDKLVSYDINDGVNLEYVTPQINIYRRAIVYLRTAEALAGVYKETHEPKAAENAFYMLKDAYKAFFPDGHLLEEQLQPAFIGVHARGCGDTYLDTTHYVLTPAAIALRFQKEEEDINYNDTINYLDELIIDELAMEATLEGNRFGDLIRFAERRSEPEFLAKRVASRKGSEHMDEELYNKLLDKANWYLPLK